MHCVTVYRDPYPASTTVGVPGSVKSSRSSRRAPSLVENLYTETDAHDVASERLVEYYSSIRTRDGKVTELYGSSSGKHG